VKTFVLQTTMMAQSDRNRIALHSFKHGPKRGWVFMATSRPLYSGNDWVPIV